MGHASDGLSWQLGGRGEGGAKGGGVGGGAGGVKQLRVRAALEPRTLEESFPRPKTVAASPYGRKPALAPASPFGSGGSLAGGSLASRPSTSRTRSTIDIDDLLDNTGPNNRPAPSLPAIDIARPATSPTRPRASIAADALRLDMMS